MAGSTNQLSLALFTYMCKHIVGTEEAVNMKRLLNTANDVIESGCFETKIISGSVGEGLEMKGSDYDLMFVKKRWRVFEDITTIQFDPADTHCVCIMEDTKAGFTKLRLIHASESIFFKLCTDVNGVLYLSNLRFILCQKNVKSVFHEVIHGPCLSDIHGVSDNAYCLHCKSWISPANEWITRHRGMWPDVDVMTKIIDHGVLFVPVGCKGSENEEIEWRISFSVGEKLLIYSFTHTQLLCYALMKILLKDVINKDYRCKDKLCSYFIKTIIFWISEDLPLSVWIPENLIQCFMQCVKRLIYCVKYSLCPHYFIQDRNLFENKIEGEVRTYLLDNLNTLISLDWHCILLSKQFQPFHVCRPLSFANTVEHILWYQSLSWLLTIKNYFQRSIQYIVFLKSSRLKQVFLFWLSLHNMARVEDVDIPPNDGNKAVYKQYKTSQYYILQSLYHDAVSGWLILASLFYTMKHYNKASYVLSYALSKFSSATPLWNKGNLSIEQITHLNCWEIMGVLRACIRLGMYEFHVKTESSLIPREMKMLESMTGGSVTMPPLAYAHFLCFLCHYHRSDVRQCYNSLRGLELTITEIGFLRDRSSQCTAYRLYGVALNLVGEYEAAKRAFREAETIDKHIHSCNCASKRMTVLENN